MADVVFIQRSWISRRLYQLQGETLLITRSYPGRNTTEEHPLRTINPDYQRRGQRFGALIVVMFVVSVLCLGLTVVILLQELVPQMFAMYPAMFGLVFLGAALRAVRRFDCFIFSDHWNRPLFFLIRAADQTAEFDTFLDDLIDRIERTQSGLPAAEPAPGPPPPSASAVALPSADDPDEARNALPRWTLSLGTGVVAALFPWLVKLLPPLEYVLFPTVFIATLFSTWWCLKSFLNKEAQRRLSLLGLALAWVPWLLY